jgi:hypothetical protein
MIQKDARLARMEQKTHAVEMVMAFVMLLLLIQLWLLNAAVEAYQAAHAALAIPTFIASMLCFLLNLGALKYLYAIDRKQE